jgi:hypothetical protein
MKRIGLVGLIMTFVVSCASISGKKVDTYVSIAGGSSGGERTFTYLKKSGNTTITTYEIKNAFVEEFKKISLYKPARTTYTQQGTKMLKGVKIQKSSDGGIEVDHLDNYGSLVESRKGTYTFKITETPTQYHVKMICPSEYHDFGTLRGGALETKPYISAEQAVENFKTICEEVKPTIQVNDYIRDEIDSKFSSEDVFANFSRILREANNYSKEEVKAFDIEKAQVFILSTPELDTTLALSVFPYRGGSKTIYAFKYPHTFLPDGTTTYKLSEVEQIKKRVSEIAND